MIPKMQARLTQLHKQLVPPAQFMGFDISLIDGWDPETAFLNRKEYLLSVSTERVRSVIFSKGFTMPYLHSYVPCDVLGWVHCPVEVTSLSKTALRQFVDQAERGVL